MDQRTVPAIARNDILAIVLAPLQSRNSVIEPKFAFGSFRSMTTKTGAFEDRLHIADKINVIGRRWRKLRSIDLARFGGRASVLASLCRTGGSIRAGCSNQ